MFKTVLRPVELRDDHAVITLTSGFSALIDIGDIALVGRFNWSVDRPVNPYARTHAAGVRWLLHRFILAAPVDLTVDHINGDRLDNRRANLRLATLAENTRNSRKRVGCSSRFKGVTWRSARSRWGASIETMKRSRTIGYFAEEEDAARAYDKAAIECFGEFARVNFPAGRT